MTTPHNTPDYVRRAYDLLHMQLFERALEEVRRALERDPRSAGAHICGAWALRSLARLPEAEQAARAALALQPDSAQAHRILALVLWDLGRASEAEVALRDALRSSDTDRALTLVDAAWLMSNTGRHREALELAEQTLALAPGMSNAHRMRGLALERLGRPEEALAEYWEALRLNPRNAAAHNSLGALRLRRGEAGIAAECFRESLRLNPNDPWARDQLVLALKARFPVYGRALALTRRRRTVRDLPRWGRVLGALFLGVYAALAVMVLFPAPAWLLPVWMGLFALGILGWMLAEFWRVVADPIFNILLWFDPLGRQVHGFDPVDAAMVVQMVCLLLGLALVAAALALAGPGVLDERVAGPGLVLATCSFLMIAGTFWYRSNGGPKLRWPVYRFALGLVYGAPGAALLNYLFPTPLRLPWVGLAALLVWLAALRLRARGR